MREPCYEGMRFSHSSRCISAQAANIVQAHKTPVSALSFNFTGTMLATASGKGTVIRVFSIPEGQKLYQFRRGAPLRFFGTLGGVRGSRSGCDGLRASGHGSISLAHFWVSAQ